MSGYTPGPWRIGNLKSYDGYTGKPYRNVWADDPGKPDDALCVARCVDVGPVDENARLIAAAPELLEACDLAAIALRIVRDEYGGNLRRATADELLKRLEAAYAKATGEASSS